MKAIIGGTGLDHPNGIQVTERRISTLFGVVPVSIGEGKDTSLVFLARHGSLHDTPPHLVNYRANIAALKKLGVDALVGVYAVGSITRFLLPGQCAVVADFLDFASASRQGTFFTGGEAGVRHVAMDQPFDQNLRSTLLAGNPTWKDGGVYVTTPGPRLETKAEIRAYRALGADYVGMTLGTEATLAKEAGIAMAAVAYSVNWAAGVAEEGMAFLSDADAGSLASSLLGAIRTVLLKERI
ncbi:MAG: MTAP family purine nucleoside phosphorylase [Sphaerochaeta sp.]|jgi:purine nucleoside phosphorylase|nr:MTAP family purine nucleoside phosphorylase [Sphaerochaeta sp.]